ncbi:MAG: inositol monophosphatase [Rhizobiales bacterium]|nr:inositol monophosphatase [Hyphomicrobiales bacterium]
MSDLVTDVADLMREVAALEIMPRFRALSSGDIEEKSRGDYVTIADKQAELWLAPRLEALVPGSVVIGEEAVAADPAILERIAADTAFWTVDPIDGTGNFVAGNETFGVMIGLVRAGVTTHGWIYLPVSDSLAVAEKGAGATWHDAQITPLRVKPAASDPATLSGAFNTRFMPPEWRSAVDSFAAQAARRISITCSAWEYTALARGEIDCITYFRMMPWDHVPGTLILREAGGVVRDMLSGHNYEARVLKGPHLVARDEESWQRVSDAIKSAL